MRLTRLHTEPLSSDEAQPGHPPLRWAGSGVRPAGLRAGSAARTALLGLFMALAGCELGVRTGAEDPPIPVHVPELLPAGEGIDPEDLDRLLRAQGAREPGPLLDALSNGTPALRARAALALASVQDPGSRAALLAALSDPEPGVRGRAAFALAHLPLTEEGAPLVRALEAEEDPQVQARILEALGRGGGVLAADAVLGWSPSTGSPAVASARQMALARMAVRGVLLEDGSDEARRVHADLLEELFAGLRDPDPEVREVSAWAFGRMPEAESWRDRADRIADALASLAPDDPAGVHLVATVGGLRRPEDIGLLVTQLREASDWRVRNTAAIAIGARQFVASEEARTALVEAMRTDPSMHVRMGAARTLAYLLPPLPDAWVEEWLDGPPDAWRVQLPFLQLQMGLGSPASILDWLEGLRGHEPAGVVAGIEVIRSLPDPEVDAFLFELASDGDARVRRAAVRLLAERWEMAPEGPAPHADLFRRQLQPPVDLPSAMASARALGDPVFHAFGAGRILEEAWVTLRDEGPEPLLERILASMGSLGDPDLAELLEEAVLDERPGVRRGAAAGLESLRGSAVRGLNLPTPVERFELGALLSLGDSPLWILETERGEIRIRLLPDQAPFTVLSMARQSEAGAFDGTPFHRVIGGFVAQGGDTVEGDGTGSAGFVLPSEFTELPFRRGVVGMASSGKDTEDTQFFLTQGLQAHLDGGYTAFGWIEEGAEVMDRILPGDLLLRARVEVR